MKTFKNYCAQGDVFITRIDNLPENAVAMAPDKTFGVIVTHSETGHHHVMEAEHVTMYSLPDSIMDCLLVVKEATPLKHLREHDTRSEEHTSELQSLRHL